MAEFSILTVCTGNICRSPLTAQLLDLGLRGVSGVNIASSGTGALIDFPMPDLAQTVARTLGVSAPETHRARALAVSHLREADLVIALSREHRRAVVEMLPRGARHTFTLRELARLLEDVPDEEFEQARPLDETDAAGRLRALVEIAASRRGMIPPPAVPDDDDVIDPYRRAESVYWASADQITPAVGVLLNQIKRAIGGAK
jgi:protein-tyrosine phosphatase